VNERRGPILGAAATAGLAVVLIAHSAGGTHLAALSTSLPTARGAQRGTPPSRGASSTTPTSSANTGGTSPPPTSGSTTTGSATGALEQYGYGELSVKVSVKGGRIVTARVVDLRTAESYSQQLAQQVIPMLKSEVLSAQSAQISAVSGATYTSEAYAASLQSALSKLGFK
jgi:uncharacterized protein with FMN-binding domain